MLQPLLYTSDKVVISTERGVCCLTKEEDEANLYFGRPLENRENKAVVL